MGASEAVAEAPPNGRVQSLDVEAAFEAYAPGVCRFLSRLGVGAEEARDLTAETFLIAHRRRADFDPERPVRPWLLGIAAQLARKHRRRAWLLGLLRGQVAPEERQKTPEEQVLGAEEVRRVHLALSRMPAEKRTLMVLRELEGLSSAEVARALEIPEGTVFSKLHHARREFVRQYRRLLLLEAAR